MKSHGYNSCRRLSVLMLASLCFAGCASTVVTRDVPRCSELVPGEWKEGIAGASLPSDDDKESWRKFGLQNAGQLSLANGRTRDTISIVEGCEKRDEAATRRRKFLGIF